MGFRCQRVHFIDRMLMRIWAVPRRVIFWSSSMLTVPGILSTYFSSPFLMTPSAPMTTGIISVPVFHIPVISISSLYTSRVFRLPWLLLLLTILLLPFLLKDWIQNFTYKLWSHLTHLTLMVRKLMGELPTMLPYTVFEFIISPPSSLPIDYHAYT